MDTFYNTINNICMHILDILIKCNLNNCLKNEITNLNIYKKENRPTSKFVFYALFGN